MSCKTSAIQSDEHRAMSRHRYHTLAVTLSIHLHDVGTYSGRIARRWGYGEQGRQSFRATGVLETLLSELGLNADFSGESLKVRSLLSLAHIVRLLIIILRKIYRKSASPCHAKRKFPGGSI